MNNDKDSLSSLIISEENKISFIESKPYADLSYPYMVLMY